MINIPAWARRAALALSLSAMSPAIAPAVIAHAQAANTVAISGDGWSMTAPADWQLTDVGQGAQNVKGALATGDTGNIYVLHQAVPPTVMLPDWLAAFKGQASTITFSQETAADKCLGGRVVCSTGLFTSSDRIGLYGVWLDKGQGWILLPSVLTTDSAAFTAALDSLTQITLSFNPN